MVNIMKNILISLITFLMVTTGLTVIRSMTTIKESLDTPTYTYTDDFGFLYKEGKTTVNGNKQAIYYGEYKAENNSKYEWVIHSIRSGSKTTRTNVLNIAKDYESTTGNKVIFAANGDYFDLNSGSNMESYVNNGIVISKGSFVTKHCIGFDNNGLVAIGRMTEVEKRLMLTVDDQVYLYNIDKYNAEPEGDEISIYNQSGTYTLNDCGRYVISTSSSNLNQCPVWGTSKRMSTGEKVSSDSLTLKSGQFAIVVKDSELNDFFFNSIIYGVEVNIVEIPSGNFADCTWVLGGYDILVNNYEVNTKCHTDNAGDSRAPRTFIGFKEDGTCFVSVVDGRMPSYSAGITVNEEASLAYELGAKYALELDGGGSSTIILRLNDELTLRNTPSDGSMRTVSNAIMLVEKEVEEETPVDPPIDDNTTTIDEPTTTVEDEPTTSEETTIDDKPTTSNELPTENNGDNNNKNTGCASTLSGIFVIPCLIGIMFFIDKKRKGDIK